MTDSTSQHASKEAKIKHSRPISSVWLIPLIALGIGLWMIYYQWANQGPMITIEFENATGLEADKTKIKTRAVDIGTVKQIELKPDMTGVIVSARIESSAAHLLTEGSKFWLVTPRISLSGISGLNTLLSGPYITMEPSGNGAKRLDFVALDEPPVTPAGTPGLHITLNSNDEFAYKEGDPIVYKGLKVGEFEDIYFNIDERVVYYNAFIEAPYHKLITENTKFWNVSGVSLELEASGIKVSTGSVETLLTNGVTFGVPEGMPTGEVITQRSYFDIFPNYEAAADERFKLGVEFVVLIKDTVRGLKVGAPVEYRGIEIGEVLDINMANQTEESLLDDEYAIPVLISIQPGRVHQPDNQRGLEFVRAQILHWVKQGLRASLKMGNFVTGALYVDLQHFSDAKPTENVTYLGYDLIPTRANEFTQITEKVSVLLDTLNAIPVEKLTKDLNSTLQEVNLTLKTVQEVAGNANQFMGDLNQQQLASAVSETLNNVNVLLTDFSAASTGHGATLQLIQQLDTTLKELTPLIQQLNRSPNSLIFADSIEPVIEPKAKTNE